VTPHGTPPADSGISVVVPTLNDRDGLDQLIQALAQQTRAPDEVVVVDGGSTDGTKELLETWRAETDVPVKIITGQSFSPLDWSPSTARVTPFTVKAMV